MITSQLIKPNAPRIQPVSSPRFICVDVGIPAFIGSLSNKTTTLHLSSNMLKDQRVLVRLLSGLQESTTLKNLVLTEVIDKDQYFFDMLSADPSCEKSDCSLKVRSYCVRNRGNNALMCIQNDRVPPGQCLLP